MHSAYSHCLNATVLEFVRIWENTDFFLFLLTIKKQARTCMLIFQLDTNPIVATCSTDNEIKLCIFPFSSIIVLAQHIPYM